MPKPPRPTARLLLLATLLLTLALATSQAMADYTLPPGNVILVNDTGIFLYNATDGKFYPGSALNTVVGLGAALTGPYDTIIYLNDNITQATNVTQLTAAGTPYDLSPLLSQLLPADEVDKYRSWPLTIVVNTTKATAIDLRGYHLKGIPPTNNNNGTLHLLIINTTFALASGQVENAGVAVAFYPNNTNTLLLNQVNLTSVGTAVFLEDEFTIPNTLVTGGVTITDSNITKAGTGVWVYDEESNDQDTQTPLLLVNNSRFQDLEVALLVSGENSRVKGIRLVNSTFEATGTLLLLNLTGYLQVEDMVFANNTVEGGTLVQVVSHGTFARAAPEAVNGLTLADNTLKNLKVLFNHTAPPGTPGYPSIPITLVFQRNQLEGHSTAQPLIGALALANPSSILIDGNTINGASLMLAFKSTSGITYPLLSPTPQTMVNFTSNTVSQGNFTLWASGVDLAVIGGNRLTGVGGGVYYQSPDALLAGAATPWSLHPLFYADAGLTRVEDNTIQVNQQVSLSGLPEPLYNTVFEIRSGLAEFRGSNTITVADLRDKRLDSVLKLGAYAHPSLASGALTVNGLPALSLTDTVNASVRGGSYSVILLRNVTNAVIENVKVTALLSLSNVSNTRITLAPTDTVHRVEVSGAVAGTLNYTVRDTTLTPVDTSMVYITGDGRLPVLLNVNVTSGAAKGLYITSVNSTAGDRLLLHNLTLDELIVMRSVGIRLENATVNSYATVVLSTVVFDRVNFLGQLILQAPSEATVVNSAFVKSLATPLKFVFQKVTPTSVDSLNATVYNNTFAKANPNDTGPFATIELYSGGLLTGNLTPVYETMKAGRVNIVFTVNGTGNWWSGAPGRDSDGDGVLDTPYTVYESIGSGWSIRLVDTAPKASPPVPVPTNAMRSAVSYPLRVTLAANVGEVARVAVNVTNTGTAYFDIVDMYFVGQHARYFSIEANYPIRVLPGTTFTFNVTFTPEAPANIDMDLIVVVEGYFDNPYNTTLVPVTIDVKARGVDPNFDRLVEQMNVYIHVTMNVANVLNQALAGVLELPAEPGQTGGVTVLEDARKVPLEKLVKGLDVEDPELLEKYDKNNDNKVTASDLARVLIENGLLKEPPKLTPEQAEQLLRQLQEVYGENLERLPTFDGKLYIAALVEQSEAS